MWVRSEYAGELAVLSAWFAALLPWNVSYVGDVLGGSALFVRFPFFQVRFLFDTAFGPPVRFLTLPAALDLQRGNPIELAYQVWAAGAVVVALAVGLSVAYYLAEDRLDATLDPVRLMGGLLALGGVVFAVAVVLLATRGFGGIPVPVGVVLMLALAGSLLGVERT
ncbi:DUF7549 family protein [Salinirubrum litoreum]|uniref:TIGR04206 family protein n=1 Tax=Salinirubrum litoreum TaxID=1126234 RepID=A0ABD5RA52_9EURY|nr:TIGR04206 family protein [Salinirubrum litoreum]